MKIRRNVKDSVFTHLFSIPKYRRELYLSLHPEDVNIGEDEIESVTLSNILSSGLYNDLGIYVKKRLIILVEAQSIWTENILWRLLYYLAESYKRKWIEEDLNIYGTKKVYLPLPELYVVYTGNKEVKEEISLKEEFFTNEECAVDLRVKVIISKDEIFKNNVQKETKYDIMQEYIEFVKIYDRNRLSGMNKDEIITKTIEECISKNILKDYLKEHESEVRSMIDMEAEQEFATRCYGKEMYNDGKAEGIAVGKAEGIAVGKAEGIAVGKVEGETFAFVKMFKQGLISEEVVMSNLNITKEELEKILK